MKGNGLDLKPEIVIQIEGHLFENNGFRFGRVRCPRRFAKNTSFQTGGRVCCRCQPGLGSRGFHDHRGLASRWFHGNCGRPCWGFDGRLNRFGGDSRGCRGGRSTRKCGRSTGREARVNGRCCSCRARARNCSRFRRTGWESGEGSNTGSGFEGCWRFHRVGSGRSCSSEGIVIS